MDNDIMLTICSRCPDMSAAKSILMSLGMWDWFIFPQIFRSRKTYHFRNLTECLGLSYDDFLFFDDDLSNIKSCQSMGVTSCHVDRKIGLNWETFVNGLILHSNELNNISLCKNNLRLLRPSIINTSSSSCTSSPSLSTCSLTTTSSESSSSSDEEDELKKNGGKFLQIRDVKAKIYEDNHTSKFRIIEQIDNMNSSKNNDYMTSVYG
jgi:hypothetical protein